MSKLVFLDTETTGLSDRAEVWEIGAILREPDQPDVEYAWQIRPTLVDAEPAGLRIGRYYERLNPNLVGAAPGTAHRFAYSEIGGETGMEATGFDVAAELAPMLDDAIVVGAVPWFDERKLQRFLAQYQQCATNRYHLVDVETLAAGRVVMAPPWEFDEVLATFGLSYDEADRHTALGDARMVRDLYDAVYRARGPRWVDSAPFADTPAAAIHPGWEATD
jgi:DNA polymerase III epsilon subunit-like protein